MKAIWHELSLCGVLRGNGSVLGSVRSAAAAVSISVVVPQPVCDSVPPVYDKLWGVEWG